MVMYGEMQISIDPKRLYFALGTPLVLKPNAEE
jgi:hypothetical protein